jgi:hypothetical protein
MLNLYEIVFEDVDPSKIEQVLTKLVNTETKIRTQKGDAAVLADAFVATQESGSWLFLNNIISLWSQDIGRHFSARVINYSGIRDFEIHFQSKVLHENDRMLLLDLCRATEEQLKAKRVILRNT